MLEFNTNTGIEILLSGQIFLSVKTKLPRSQIVFRTEFIKNNYRPTSSWCCSSALLPLLTLSCDGQCLRDVPYPYRRHNLICDLKHTCTWSLIIQFQFSTCEPMERAQHTRHTEHFDTKSEIMLWYTLAPCSSCDLSTDRHSGSSSQLIFIVQCTVTITVNVHCTCTLHTHTLCDLWWCRCRCQRSQRSSVCS